MAGNNSLLEKLEGLVSRFEEISTLITDPAVIADQKRYVKLTKEYKDLNGLMKLEMNTFKLSIPLMKPKKLYLTKQIRSYVTWLAKS